MEIVILENFELDMAIVVKFLKRAAVWIFELSGQKSAEDWSQKFWLERN